jgi:hypothetical protein
VSLHGSSHCFRHVPCSARHCTALLSTTAPLSPVVSNTTESASLAIGVCPLRRIILRLQRDCHDASATRHSANFFRTFSFPKYYHSRRRQGRHRHSFLLAACSCRGWGQARRARVRGRSTVDRCLMLALWASILELIFSGLLAPQCQSSRFLLPADRNENGVLRAWTIEAVRQFWWSARYPGADPRA